MASWRSNLAPLASVAFEIELVGSQRKFSGEQSKTSRSRPYSELTPQGWASAACSALLRAAALRIASRRGAVAVVVALMGFPYLLPSLKETLAAKGRPGNRPFHYGYDDFFST